MCASTQNHHECEYVYPCQHVMALNNVPHVFPSSCDYYHAFCHSRMAMLWSGNICWHTGWSCLIAQLLCHRVTIWLHGVPVLPCGGLGMPACVFSMSKCHLFTIYHVPVLIIGGLGITLYACCVPALACGNMGMPVHTPASS